MGYFGERSTARHDRSRRLDRLGRREARCGDRDLPSRASLHDKAADLAGVDLVIEAATENKGLK